LPHFAPPDSLTQSHTKLSESGAAVRESVHDLLERQGQHLRRHFWTRVQLYCRGLYLLYRGATHCRPAGVLGCLPEALPHLTAWKHKLLVWKRRWASATNRARMNMVNIRPMSGKYALQQSWPLIVCLHGGYGRGTNTSGLAASCEEQRLSVALAEVLGPTWSVLNPPLDVRSIQAMLGRGLCCVCR